MENKYLINVMVPILEESYSVFIPVGKTIESTTILLKKCISELTDGAFDEKADAYLYDSDGKLLDRNVYVKNSGITNGSKIILV